MEERISCVIQSAENVGFENFDSLVAEYYTRRMDVMSSIHDLQRTSRSRRLGPLLHAISESAKSWSEYERQGYEGEICKAAEVLYRKELQQVIQKASLNFTPDEAHLRIGDSIRTETLKAEKGNLQSQVRKFKGGR